MAYDLNFLLSDEAAKGRYTRSLACRRDLDILGGPLTHVVWIEKAGKFTEMDASGKLHALTLLNEIADHWTWEAISIRKINDDGTLSAPIYHHRRAEGF